MPKKQVRNRAYYERRLRNEFPAINADLRAGKYRTVTDAAIAAGIKKSRTRLRELKNAWNKASPTEQDEFLKWIDAKGAPPGATPISSNGHLLPDAVI